MALWDSYNFENEKMMSLQFRGRDHILQRQLGHDLAEGDMQGPMDRALRASEGRMILFEFAEFGSLFRLLKKVSSPVTDDNDPRR
ncbi:hypothetical protein N0V93_000761 [Gnomoniopsis smithogilvyi]|uniref:Uncharacterized protein n=1 Tax=Gnomoniopsis smithogilvyi TaxID=1191159 RepID=A0A9W8Z291_9PEZI|nr:hypothetical protein N0V93_000761 [Gnomoniopsis smithogilvyi]